MSRDRVYASDQAGQPALWPRRCLILVQVFLILTSSAAEQAQNQKPAPPGQPTHGPGGSDYLNAKCKVSELGKGSERYWLFEPAEPRPAVAPVIVFLHGWGAMQPGPYRAWLEHITRRGNIVIYPRYQQGLHAAPAGFLPAAVASVKAALAELKGNPDRVPPDLGKTAVVGHSAGGLLAANMAAVAVKSDLPSFKAVMCVEPCRIGGADDKFAVPLEDLSRIPHTSLLLVVAGDRDRVAGQADARRIFREANQVPGINKDFILIRSDEYGEPALLATHLAPCAPIRAAAGMTEAAKSDATAQAKPKRRGVFTYGRAAANAAGPDPSDEIERIESGGYANLGATGIGRTDALDYYGTWKLFDALCTAAFRGDYRDSALGGGERQINMGRWSDGRPVRPLLSTDDPDRIEETSNAR